MISVYSPQGTAISGRKTYNKARISRPPYYPKKAEPAQGADIAQPMQPAPPVKPVIPLYTPSPMAPPGDMDTSAGLPEGFSNTSGFQPMADLNESGLAAQQGHYGQAVAKGAKGIFGMIAAPALAPLSIISKPISEYVVKPISSTIKGLLSSDTAPAVAPGNMIGDTNVDVAIGSQGPMGLAAVESALGGQGSIGGVGGLGALGVDAGIGTSGPMGLAAAESGIDLGSLDMGGVGGDGGGDMGIGSGDMGDSGAVGGVGGEW